MATVTNPTSFSAFCHPLGRSIGPRGSIEVEDELAAKVSTVVFVVEGLPEDDPAEETEETEERSVRPTTRQTGRRGGKVAEVTEGVPSEER